MEFDSVYEALGFLDKKRVEGVNAIVDVRCTVMDAAGEVLQRSTRRIDDHEQAETAVADAIGDCFDAEDDLEEEDAE